MLPIKYMNFCWMKFKYISKKTTYLCELWQNMKHINFVKLGGHHQPLGWRFSESKDISEALKRNLTCHNSTSTSDIYKWISEINILSLSRPTNLWLHAWVKNISNYEIATISLPLVCWPIDQVENGWPPIVIGLRTWYGASTFLSRWEADGFPRDHPCNPPFHATVFSQEKAHWLVATDQLRILSWVASLEMG